MFPSTSLSHGILTNHKPPSLPGLPSVVSQLTLLDEKTNLPKSQEPIRKPNVNLTQTHTV